VAVGEFLLELTGQSVNVSFRPANFMGMLFSQKRTAAGSCGSPGGEGRERRWR
jgi:hypothetical protein